MEGLRQGSRNGLHSRVLLALSTAVYVLWPMWMKHAGC
jgi:hypothetical protein